MHTQLWQMIAIDDDTMCWVRASRSNPKCTCTKARHKENKALSNLLSYLEAIAAGNIECVDWSCGAACTSWWTPGRTEQIRGRGGCHRETGSGLWPEAGSRWRMAPLISYLGNYLWPCWRRYHGAEQYFCGAAGRCSLIHESQSKTKT